MSEPGFHRQWRFYTTVAGNSPVKRFIEMLTDEDAAEVVAELKAVRAEDPEDATCQDCARQGSASRLARAWTQVEGLKDIIYATSYMIWEARMPKDDLDRLIAERSKRNPHFPDLVEAAEKRRLFARQLAAVRKQYAELSQTRIAAAMGTSPSIVSRLERGADVRLSTLQKYAAVLGCDLKVELIPKAR